jgi:TatD DNase family protein
LFLDSHCHLDKLRFGGIADGLSSAIAVARDRDVHRFLCIGIGLGNLDQVVAIAEQFPDVYAAVGIHPSEFVESEYRSSDPALLLDTQGVMTRLRALALHPKVIALGETGLDFYHDGHEEPAARHAQLQSFEAHLALAKELHLPVVVHTRNARQQTLAAIRAADSPFAGVLHCFTEDWDTAQAAMDMGYYVSISGIVTFKNADNVRDVAARLPLDRLLVETDSPWLAPVPHRGKPNEPRFVVDVYHYLAELRQEPVERLAEAVWLNFQRLFAV